MNRSTAIACDVIARVDSSDSGWVATITANDAIADQDHFLLVDLGNPWVLRFPDGSELEVNLGPSGQDGTWLVTELAPSSG